jgi:FKBP-type peptidyl-prolyl cis-trans isomerase
MIPNIPRAVFLCGYIIAVSNTVYAKDTVELETNDQKLSYSLGYQTGSSFKEVKHMKLDVDIFLRGASDRLKDQTSAMSDEAMKKAISTYQQRVMTLQDEHNKILAEKNKKASDAFLTANKAKKGIVATPSGLQYEVLKPGTGPIPAEDDVVVAHYRATFIDGKEFANTYKNDEPATFTPKVVIPGWREALLQMKEGAEWRIFIPPDLAYGNSGSPPLIEPGVVTIFDVKILSVKKEEDHRANEKKSVDTTKSGTDKKPAKKAKSP